MTSAEQWNSSCEVRSYTPGEYAYFVEMYDNFKPKGMFQGMPPRAKNIRDKWINTLIENGENFLAWLEGQVIGHVAILPDFDKRDAEYLIFVSQKSRGRGVGKDLTRMAIEKAKALDLKQVWLTVDAYNFRGIKLYRRFGFEFREEHGSASERTMLLNL